MQRRATVLQANESQLQLIPEASITSLPVSLERIYSSCVTPHDALLYACEIARENGRPIQPKQIYSRMDKDATRWSRICSGEHDLPLGDVVKLCKTLNNDVVALSLNHWLGYDLTTMRKTLDDKDRRIAELEAQVAERDKRIETIIEYERQKESRR